MPLLGFWQAPVACTPVGGMPRRAPGQAGQLRGGSAGGAASTPGVGLPQRGAQTSLPRTTRCGSLESYFKRISLRQRTHGTYSMSALTYRANSGAARRWGRRKGLGEGQGSSQTIVKEGYSQDKKHLAKRAEDYPFQSPRF